LYTLVSDMFPRQAVGSVVGLGTFTGGIGGFILQIGAGIVIGETQDYLPIFAIAGTSYLLALLVIHLLVPHIQPVVWDDAGAPC